MNEVPISHGIDFERAREKLSNNYGRAFVEYSEAKRNNAPALQAEDLLRRAQVAQRELRALKPSDTEKIAQILASGEGEGA